MSIHKLTTTGVEKLIKGRKLGKHGDGGGLYLRIDEGADGKTLASWIFRYERNGRESQIGLGATHTIDLEAAREAARRARASVHGGRDPRGGIVAGGGSMLFQECARLFFETYRIRLTGPKVIRDWESSMKTYIYPTLGKVPVNEIDHLLVLKALEPIWTKRPKLAPTLRSHVEKILEWATVKGHRTGDNPARWSLLSAVLLSDFHVVKHHAALPHADLPAFMSKLRQQEGVAARCLEFVILCGCRTGDVKGGNPLDREPRPPMQWSHLDLDQGLWTVPKTKSGTEHLVPLSGRAVAILKEIRAYNLDDRLVFPSLDNPGRSMCHRAMPAVLKRMGYLGVVTVHGFRATFKTWAGDETDFEDKVIEAVLAHGVISDKLEAAYRRGDFFAKRRRLMAAWAAYAGSGDQSAQVVPLREAA